jgi:hypothetical protein
MCPCALQVRGVRGFCRRRRGATLRCTGLTSAFVYTFAVCAVCAVLGDTPVPEESRELHQPHHLRNAGCALPEGRCDLVMWRRRISPLSQTDSAPTQRSPDAPSDRRGYRSAKTTESVVMTEAAAVRAESSAGSQLGYLASGRLTGASGIAGWSGPPRRCGGPPACSRPPLGRGPG